MTTLIHQATIVNEGEQYIGSVLIKDNRIAAIIRGTDITGISADHVINAEGLERCSLVGMPQLTSSLAP